MNLNNTKMQTSTDTKTNALGMQFPQNYNPASYQEYYQQYMQYMYQVSSMYNYAPYTNATSVQMNQMPSTNYYPSTLPTSQQKPPPPPPPPPSSLTSSLVSELDNTLTETTPHQPTKNVPPIKINLKFQQQPKLMPTQIGFESNEEAMQTESIQPVRKSRFDVTTVDTPTTTTTTTTITANTNIAKQHSLYQQYQQQQKLKQQQQQQKLIQQKQQAASQQQKQQQLQTNATSTTTATDIVTDINKWPASLKNYCSRIYQKFKLINSVTEQQVTNYLQIRITEAFKIKADLNINWDSEKIPDVNTIKQLNGLANVLASSIPTTTSSSTVSNQRTFDTKPQQVKAQQQIQQRTPFQQRMNNLNSNIEENLNLKRRSKSRSSENSSKRSRSTSSSRTHSSSESASHTTTTSSSSSVKKFKKDSFNSISKRNGYKSNEISSRLNVKRTISYRKSDDEDNVDGVEYSDNEERQSDEDFKPLSAKRTFKNKAKSMKFEIKNDFIDDKKLTNRAQRFQYENNQISSKRNKSFKSIFALAKEQEGNSFSMQENVCIGICQDLEKEYLRLTGAPEPVNVRPLNVLKKSLDFVLDKYSKTNDYRYICDQLKAIRQDLTVQMIRNEFTIHVYETHARIAIMKADRDEFNQCQSQLKCLYSTNPNVEGHATEFIGYRLLYFILTKSYKDLNQVIKEIKLKYKNDKYLNHLLMFRNAWHMNNYVKLFQLYKTSNQMCKYLIDLFIERERKLALKLIIKSYRPHIKLDKIKDLLAYESINKCKEDLISYGLCITTAINDDTNNKQIEIILDCKSSNIQNL